MNTTTLNMTTLDGGIIIKKGEGGGSTPPSGVESGVECFYYNQKSTPLNFRDSWKDLSVLVKIKVENMTAIIPTSNFMCTMGEGVLTEDTVEAVCIANHMVCLDPSIGLIPLVETIQMFDKYPFITKEQFYSLD